MPKGRGFTAVSITHILPYFGCVLCKKMGEMVENKPNPPLKIKCTFGALLLFDSARRGVFPG